MQAEYSCYLSTPLGCLRISGTVSGLTQITFQEEEPEHIPAEIPEYLQAARLQLAEYFAGQRQIFHLKLSPNGTAFQQQVWQQLSRIPFGKTESYLTIARQLGEPNITRAVGAANGRNPLVIVVPCHRVIGADGSLTGYAGGLWRKKWLLQLEGHFQQAELFAAETHSPAPSSTKNKISG